MVLSYVTCSISWWRHRIFRWHNPSGRTIVLRSTQPLTDTSTRNISWVVGAAGAYDWQPYHLHEPIVSKSGSLNLLEPSGPVIGLYRDCFTFTFTYIIGVSFLLHQNKLVNILKCCGIVYDLTVFGRSRWKAAGYFMNVLMALNVSVTISSVSCIYDDKCWA